MSGVVANSSANFYPGFVPLSDDWNNLFMGKVDVENGVLTNPQVVGNLTLGQTPSLDLHAASKAYVDAVVGGGGGGTGGGGIPEAPADGTPYCRLNHAWTPAPTTLGGNVVGDLHVSGGLYSATVSATGDITAGGNLHVVGGTIDQGQGGAGTIIISCQLAVLGATFLTGAVTASGGVINTPIGATNPSTGAFTSLTTTGNATVGGTLAVNGTTGQSRFAGDLAIGATAIVTASTGDIVTTGLMQAPIGGFSGPVGKTVPNTGAFTTVSASGAVTFSSTLAVSGVLTAPTAAQTVNNTQVATTAYVKAAIAAGSGYTLPTATTTVLGGVKIDGSTITIDGGGVIRAPSAAFIGGTVPNATTFSAAGTALTVTNTAQFGPITRFTNPAASGSSRLILNWASFADPTDAAGLAFWNAGAGSGMFGTGTGNQISFYPSDINGAPIGNTNAYWARVTAAGFSVNGTLTTTGNATIGGNLTVTGGVSGAGLTGLFASPPPIGSGAANTGQFTVLTAASANLTGPVVVDTTADPHNLAIPLSVKAGDFPEIHITNISGGGWPAVKMYGAIGGDCAYVEGNRILANGSTATRWALELGTTHPESGGNVGTQFNLRPFDDTGAPLPPILGMTRLGVVTWGASPQSTLQMTPGAATTVPFTLNATGTGGLTLGGAKFTLGTGTQNKLTMTPGAGGTNPFVLTLSGTGMLTLPTTSVPSQLQVGAGTSNMLWITPGVGATDPITMVAVGSGGLQFGTSVSFGVTGQNVLTIAPGNAPNNITTLSNSGTGAMGFAASSFILGSNPQNTLTITPGAAVTNPVTLAPSGSGGIAFSSTVTAPTPAPTTNDGTIATTAYVTSAIAGGSGFTGGTVPNLTTFTANGTALTVGGAGRNALSITAGSDPAQPIALGQSGTGGVQLSGGQLILPLTGTVTAPSLAFAGFINTGIYPGAGSMYFTTNGTNAMLIGTAVTAMVPFRAQDGAMSQPAYSFSGEATSGLYRPTTNVLNMTINGVVKTQWTTGGFQVGGTPNNILTIAPGAAATNPVTLAPSGSGAVQVLGASGLIVGAIGTNYLTVTPGSATNQPLVLTASGQPSTGIQINANVGFNSTPPIARQTVTGTRANGAAYAALLTAMAACGLVTDASTAGALALADMPAPMLQIPVPFAFAGKPTINGVVNVPIAMPMTVPANLAGTVVFDSGKTTNNAAFTLNKVTAGGTVTALGTVTITNISNTSATLTGAGGSLAVGDTLQIASPAIQDATLSDLGITILCARA